jgi:hypothetical protein
VTRLAVVAGWAGLLSLELLVARSYLSYGTWWHYLLHQYVGWGAGLALAAVVAACGRYRIPVVAALVGGQLASIVPDLQFRFQRMPHMAHMDIWLGHISIHRGPSPTLVALGALLLGGAAWLAGAYLHRRTAIGLAVATAGLVLVGCVAAEPVPSTLEEFPTGPVSTFG